LRAREREQLSNRERERERASARNALRTGSGMQVSVALLSRRLDRTARGCRCCVRLRVQPLSLYQNSRIGKRLRRQSRRLRS
jgi:hypothetical protein